MNYRAASRKFVLIDLMLCIQLIMLIILVFFSIYATPGIMVNEMCRSQKLYCNIQFWVWIIIIMYVYLLCCLMSTDKAMMHITEQVDYTSHHAIQVCQSWITISWFAISFGVLVFALISIQKLLLLTSEFEEHVRWAILIYTSAFVTQRIFGVYLVGNFKEQLTISLINSLCPDNDISVNITNDDFPPMYEDVVHINVDEPPPPYSAVILPSNNWI